jgi:hypothetical protein
MGGMTAAGLDLQDQESAANPGSDRDFGQGRVLRPDILCAMSQQGIPGSGVFSVG